MTRATIETELGTEIFCSRCQEFWPCDPEFFFFTKGKPHSWCKACYTNSPSTAAKRVRYATKHSKKTHSPQETQAAFAPQAPGLAENAELFTRLFRPLQKFGGSSARVSEIRS